MSSNLTTLDDMRKDAGSLLQSITGLLTDYTMSEEDKKYLSTAKRRIANVTLELRMMASGKASSGGGDESFTLEEIATKFGITRERVRQIESMALKHLRHPRYGRKLRHYLADDYSLVHVNTINDKRFISLL